MSSEIVLWSLSLLLGLEYEILFGTWLDAALILGLTIWKDGALSVPVEILDESILSLALKATLAVLAAYTWFRLRLYLMVGDVDNVSSAWTGLGRPLLIPARTTHRRIFPEKHAFSHSYLVVGVPVGWQGSWGGMISTNAAPLGRDKSLSSTGSPSNRAWFHVDGGDHLMRGPGTLKEKLHEYLEAQDVDPALYPHAYLVTAASFLGYSFNPVSFWYLYSEAKELSAMVLEVNNTFGERRMYLLRADDRPYTEDKKTISGNASIFKRSWPKDFHVSPFNSRKGAYSAQIHDVLASNDGDRPGRLDGTITLSSSQGHAKIVARLFAEGNPVDPSTKSLFDKARFLLGWWWVGFATFPRIVKEATVLFFRRNLHVWYRPEPLKETIGRAADSTEGDLAPLFRGYLRHLVSKSTANISVKYIPSGGNEQPEIMRTSAAAAAAAAEKVNNAPTGSSKCADNPDDKDLVTVKGVDDPDEVTQHLEFQVLTPAFYTRFVHYAHDFEAVFSELRDNCTIHVSRPELLPSIFVSQTPASPLRVGSPLDFVYFSAIRSLRGPPERIDRPMTSSAAATLGPSSRDTSTHTVRDVRGFRISGLDGWVLSGAGAEMKRRYRSLVLRLFLAEKVAFGSVGLLWMEEFILRAGVAWMLSSGVGCMVAKAAGELYDRFT